MSHFTLNNEINYIVSKLSSAINSGSIQGCWGCCFFLFVCFSSYYSFPPLSFHNLAPSPCHSTGPKSFLWGLCCTSFLGTLTILHRFIIILLDTGPNISVNVLFFIFYYYLYIIILKLLFYLFSFLSSSYVCVCSPGQCCLFVPSLTLKNSLK